MQDKANTESHIKEKYEWSLIVDNKNTQGKK